MSNAIRWTKEQLAEYNARAMPKPQPVQYAKAIQVAPKAKRRPLPATIMCCGYEEPATLRSRAEHDYACLLESAWEQGKIKRWAHEAIRLKIGPSVWFKPDFWVVMSDWRQELHEVKGAYIREAGRVRVRAAAQQYREFAWFLAQQVKGVWTVERI